MPPWDPLRGLRLRPSPRRAQKWISTSRRPSHLRHPHAQRHAQLQARRWTSTTKRDSTFQPSSPRRTDHAHRTPDYDALLYNLRDTYRRWAEEGTPVIAHVAWPVEARLFLDMLPGDDIWIGPYPLVDVASVLLAKGHDPLSVDKYLAAHNIPAPPGSPHHPLYDARAAERCLRHLMTPEEA